MTIPRPAKREQTTKPTRTVRTKNPRPEARETAKTKGGKERRQDRRWKTDERATAKLYQRIDGMTENKTLQKLITRSPNGDPIGRLGHLSDLRVDSCSKSYMIESKRRSLPKWLHTAWCQVQQIARDYEVEPVLVCTMVDQQNSYEYQGKQVPCEDLHVISGARHASLLRCERQVDAVYAFLVGEAEGRPDQPDALDVLNGLQAYLQGVV